MFINNYKKQYYALKRLKTCNKELLNALAYVRNMVILNGNQSISAEKLLEDMAKMSKELRPAFEDMGAWLHVNNKDAAAGVLYEIFETGFSKDLGRFLASWDDVAQEDLLGTLEIYLDSMREEQLHKRQKRDEVFSDLVYLPVVLNSMLILLNFVYVAYFIGQQDLLSNLFF